MSDEAFPWGEWRSLEADGAPPEYGPDGERITVCIGTPDCNHPLGAWLGTSAEFQMKHNGHSHWYVLPPIPDG